MQITKNRIRREYQPLSVAAGIAVVSESDSPLTQVYDELLNVYQPNRELTPLVLIPSVVLTASDGSMKGSLTNVNIASDTMKWMLNGTDITKVDGWRDKVTIDTSESASRGRLTIARNVKPGEVASLYFECDVPDTRTGKNIHITTEALLLATTDKSEDDWEIAISGARNVLYNPVDDMLAEMEYEMAQGIATYNETEMEEARKSVGSYVQEWNFTVRKGKSIADNSLYTVNHYVHAGSKKILLTEDNMADYPVSRFGRSVLAVDLRLVDNVTFTTEVVSAVGNQVASITYGAARRYETVTWDYLNQTDAQATEDMRDDMVLARGMNGMLKYPERTHNILWYVTDAEGENHFLNMGAKTRYSMKEYGLSDTAEIAEFVATEDKPTYRGASTSEGKVLTDGQGKEFIFTTLSE